VQLKTHGAMENDLLLGKRQENGDFFIKNRRGHPINQMTNT